MYLREFRQHWSPLIGAALGLGVGSSMAVYTMSLFGPALIEEFGWSRADFALIGMLGLVGLVFIPLAGRLVDFFGARMAALIGFTILPLSFLAFTMMNGEIGVFFAIYVTLHMFGLLTTPIVFCRVVVERFSLARGVALAIVMSAPPLFGALIAPPLGALIDTEGWRAGYYALAALSALGGFVAIFS